LELLERELGEAVGLRAVVVLLRRRRIRHDRGHVLPVSGVVLVLVRERVLVERGEVHAARGRAAARHLEVLEAAEPAEAAEAASALPRLRERELELRRERPRVRAHLGDLAEEREELLLVLLLVESFLGLGRELREPRRVRGLGLGL